MAKITIRSKFGVIPNDLLNNINVTLKAKGLYAFIQSKPDNWDFSVERLASQLKESIDSVRTGLIELEGAGYLQRVRGKDEKGFFCVDYILHSESILENPYMENPTSENPMQDNPRLENHPNNSNKENTKKDNSKIDNNNVENEKSNSQSDFSSSELKQKKAPQTGGRRAKKEKIEAPEILFSESNIFEFEAFEEYMQESYPEADPNFYYIQVKNWLNSDGTKPKRKNWKKVVGTFISNDIRSEKLKTSTEYANQQRESKQQASSASFQKLASLMFD